MQEFSSNDTHIRKHTQPLIAFSNVDYHELLSLYSNIHIKNYCESVPSVWYKP